MTSIRHIARPAVIRATPTSTPPAPASSTSGWRRTTLTEVARRAGVSRMTIYRTWPDMQTLLGDLMTREWSASWPRRRRRRGRRPGRAGRRGGRDGPGAARRRAVRPDRRARPRAAAALPARAARPLPGPGPRSCWSTASSGPGRRRDPRRATRCRSPAALVLGAHGFVLSAHTMVDDAGVRGRPRRRARHAAGPGARPDDPARPGSAPARPASPRRTTWSWSASA